jgi:DNA mismatch endonuclease (patch repair protein)
VTEPPLTTHPTPFRSSLMKKVRQRHTKPEMMVRSAVHALGYRFRLHRRDLPGSPDLVLPKHRVVVFVHGCFWHRHAECRHASTPKTNVEFWLDKFRRNVARDARKEGELQQLGWRVLVIWECETRDPVPLIHRISEFLVGAREAH